MELSEVQRRIVDVAKAHDGRYLLRRRFREAQPKSELDIEYEACQSLVWRGLAHWLPSDPGPGPGVELHTKALTS